MAFVLRHGVVLVSAKGPAPRLTEAIAREAIRGSCWGWVPAEIVAAADRLTTQQAEAPLQNFIPRAPLKI